VLGEPVREPVVLLSETRPLDATRRLHWQPETLTEQRRGTVVE
jgi:hypothetical protein